MGELLVVVLPMTVWGARLFFVPLWIVLNDL